MRTRRTNPELPQPRVRRALLRYLVFGRDTSCGSLTNWPDPHDEKGGEALKQTLYGQRHVWSEEWRAASSAWGLICASSRSW
jgi:hypothetical protein